MKILLPIISVIAFFATLYFLANRSPLAALISAVIGAILMTIFWILMIISAIKRKHPSDEAKIIWILVVILLGHLGALIYYFAVDIKEEHRIK
jgi:NADH:ubiquinone oxidoreductase subunit 6 (subunit J)